MICDVSDISGGRNAGCLVWYTDETLVIQSRSIRGTHTQKHAQTMRVRKLLVCAGGRWHVLCQVGQRPAT